MAKICAFVKGNKICQRTEEGSEIGDAPRHGKSAQHSSGDSVEVEGAPTDDTLSMAQNTRMPASWLKETARNRGPERGRESSAAHGADE